MKLIFVFIFVFQQIQPQTLAQIEHQVFGTPLNTQREQKITDLTKLTNTSDIGSDTVDKKSFFELKEMKDIMKEKQQKAEKDRKLEIQKEEQLKSNEIDVSGLINQQYLDQNQQQKTNKEGRKLFFGKIVSTVKSWFRGIGRKKGRGGKGRKSAPPKPQTYFKFNSEKDYLDKRNQFKSLKEEGYDEKNLYKHLFGHINLKKVMKKFKRKNIKIPYYKTVMKKKCLSKQNGKCLASMMMPVKVKKYKSVYLKKGQIPFTKYIITSLATGNEFKAKEIRRFEIFAQGYQRLFKNKIIQRYQKEKERQIKRWDTKWNKARSKYELKYQRQLHMALAAYHQFLENTKMKNDKKYRKIQRKTRKYNIKQIKKTIKKKVNYYMKKYDKKYKKINKKIKKKMDKNDHRDEENMKKDFLRNKFINRAYFANAKVEGKVPEAYKLDKTPLLK